MREPENGNTYPSKTVNHGERGAVMESCILLVDFNNLLFRTLHARDVGIHSEVPSFTLWRYLVYDSIYQSIRHIGNVSEVVLAIDDRNHWRKAYFPRYKEDRKAQRDKTGLNWDFIFKVVNKYVSDVKHHMPFKVLRIRSAEADDTIAIIAMETNKKCIISSNDEDFLQLSSDRILIWSPSKREYISCPDTEKFLLEKFLTGQKKDGIFNVKTPTNWGKTEETFGKRKPPLGPVTAQKIMDEGVDQWIEKNDYEKNFHRNKVLIDFRMIPNTIRNRIFDAYDNYSFPPPENMYKFFKNYSMTGFIEDFDTVEKHLMRLYV